jgi:hypothetical protein
MPPLHSRRYNRALAVVATLVALIGCSWLSAAQAADPLGLYVGGAVGWGQVAASLPYTSLAVPSATEFKNSSTAFEFMLGLHPVPALGAEVQYVDLGHPSGNIYGFPANASVKGESVFGVVYLPIPVIDVYGKAGVARLQTSASGFFPTGGFGCTTGSPCSSIPFQLSRTTSDFAMGAGAQIHFGAWAIRAEYERFNAAGANPSLAVIGFTWTFL